MKKTLLLIGVIVTFPVCLFAYTSPGKPQGFVSDFAHIMSATDIQAMNVQLQALQNSSGAQVAVVTIQALGNETIETYATKLFQEWGIGTKGKDNGLLILVAPNDRVARIEVGYGLEGAVTDIQAGNIVDKTMIPIFKGGDYSTGIKDGVDAVTLLIQGSPEAQQYYTSPAQNNSGTHVNIAGIFFFFIIVVNALARILGSTKSWWLGGVLGAGAGIIIGLIWGFVFIGFGAIVILTIVGLIFDYIVSKNPPGSGGGGFWPIFFGGGRGGFGGGFGGFGGGSSGGGGASGRW